MHDGVVCWDAVSSQPRLHADGNSFPLFTLRVRRRRVRFCCCTYRADVVATQAAMGNSGVLIGSMGTLFGFLSGGLLGQPTEGAKSGIW